MNAKLCLMLLVIVIALPPTAAADDPFPLSTSGPLPEKCIDITPHTMPPIDIYDCPEGS